VNEHGVWMASVAATIEDVIRSHSPFMFDDDFDEYHVNRAMEGLSNDEFSDSFEEFEQVFANCNECGDIGVLEKECWCGGTFDVSRDPNVVPVDVEVPANEPTVSASVPIVEAFNQLWGGRALMNGLRTQVEDPPQNPHVEIPLRKHQDVGAKPSTDGVEPESRRCTGCGSIDLFHQQSPFACLCGSLRSIPWFGVPEDKIKVATID